jgi:virulence-associated protein VapD
MRDIGVGHNRTGRRPPVFAITFDLDTESLEKLYPSDSWRNAYTDIRKFLEGSGFEHKQGSVYFSVDDLDAVECVTIAQDLAAEFDWFTPCVKDIRMLRIEDNNDLMPALDRDLRRRKKK